MNNELKVKQNASDCANVIQVAEQNNTYIGLSPIEATKLAIDLFKENFPKLQEEANNIILDRVNDLTNKVIEKMIEEKITEFSAFKDPDIQLALLQAQKIYARFGEQDKMQMLTEILVRRIKNNNEDLALKVAIDKAIEIAGLINESHLDTLSLTFFIKNVNFKSIKTAEDFQIFLDNISKVFSKAKKESFGYLNSLGCYSMSIGNPQEFCERNYPFIKDKGIKYPSILTCIHDDYRTSHVGTILAIANAEIKTSYTFQSSIWIHS